MNSLTKKRLVGMLVIFSLVTLFWPAIFTPQEFSGRVDLVKAPPVPQVEMSSQIILDLKNSDLEKEKTGILLSSANSKDSIPVGDHLTRKGEELIHSQLSSKDRVRSVSPEKPFLDSKGLPISYILQVVSMSDMDRAKNVRNTLLELNHKAYMRKAKLGEDIMYRVYVGPKLERAKLLSIKPKIDELFTVDSVILRYAPDSY